MDILMMIKDKKIQMIDSFTKQKFLPHFMVVSTLATLLQIILQYSTILIPTNQKTKITHLEVKVLEIGNTIIQGKKVTMEHLQNFHNISKKERNLELLKNNRKFGCNITIYYRPNFNGTSKNFG
jgi:hypothetical protein